MIVTGEASGDLHGGSLVKAVASHAPDVSFFGVGSRNLEKAGCDLILDSGELSAMGLFEVFGRLPTILRHFRSLKKVLHGNAPPDLLVLIDFPDFNLRLAAEAQKAGIPVLYYISPKFWAWRQGRLQTIARVVDRIAVIFPFEVPHFQRHGVDVSFVGNPLLDDLESVPGRLKCRETFDLSADDLIVGLFPGSRESEIRFNLPTMLETAKLLLAKNPEMKFLLPVAPNLSKASLDEQVTACKLPVTLVPGELFEAARACDAALVVSGTATLQTGLVGTPLAVIFKCSPASFAIGRRLVKLKHVSLVNIISGAEIVKEFLQDAASPQALADEMGRLIHDSDYRVEMLERLATMRSEMGEPGCSQRVARMVLEMLEKEGGR